MYNDAQKIILIYYINSLTPKSTSLCLFRIVCVLVEKF